MGSSNFLNDYPAYMRATWRNCGKLKPVVTIVLSIWFLFQGFYLSWSKTYDSKICTAHSTIQLIYIWCHTWSQHKGKLCNEPQQCLFHRHCWHRQRNSTGPRKTLHNGTSLREVRFPFPSASVTWLDISERRRNCHLGSGEAVLGPAEGMTVLVEKCVLLLNS